MNLFRAIVFLISLVSLTLK